MKRSPALILLASLLAAALFARLGFWQLDRARQKTDRQEAIDQRQSLPALTGDRLAVDAVTLETQFYRKVQLQGQWQGEATLHLDNRPMAGRPGFIVITPLQLADGTAVIIQRGWQPRDPQDRTRFVATPTPGGVVTVSGRIAPPPARLYEFETQERGPIRQNVDIPGLAAETGLRLRPLSVLQLEPPDTGPDGLLREWPLPATGVHKHYGYAFQWFALCALTLCLYVWFQIIQPRRARTAATTSRAGGA
ncbi:MAG: SURF1 family protein [Rubrivivax sp.]|nr:SURF1 family protein [Rubrivivax sp.]